MPQSAGLRPTSRWSHGQKTRCFSAVRSDAIGPERHFVAAWQFGRFRVRSRHRLSRTHRTGFTSTLPSSRSMILARLAARIRVGRGFNRLGCCGESNEQRLFCKRPQWKPCRSAEKPSGIRSSAVGYSRIRHSIKGSVMGTKEATAHTLAVLRGAWAPQLTRGRFREAFTDVGRDFRHDRGRLDRLPAPDQPGSDGNRAEQCNILDGESARHAGPEDDAQKAH